MKTCPTPDHIYARRDWRVVDYQCARLEGSDRLVRGPLPASLEPGAYFACLGAAQTFGCFCEQPFPSLLEERLGLPALNLGFGGAGPAYFLRRPELIDYANRAKFVVLQALSGRSASNSIFESQGGEQLTRRSDGSVVGADAAYGTLLRESALLTIPLGEKRVVHLLPPSPRRLERLIEETRQDWLASMARLLGVIRVPVIWFWFSKRTPHYRQHYWTVHHLMGDFPQLVNQEMSDVVGQAADMAVECVSSRGVPQPLSDRFTGERAEVAMDSGGRPDLAAAWNSNIYYPSPEMHEDAAAALEPVCRRLLQG